jgi:hypothetical protein
VVERPISRMATSLAATSLWKLIDAPAASSRVPSRNGE